MFMNLGSVEYRSVFPYCSSCSSRSPSKHNPTTQDLEESGRRGCQLCKLFHQAISNIFLSEARLSNITWYWNDSVLTGSDYQQLSTTSSTSRDTPLEYHLEFFISAESKGLLANDLSLLTQFHIGGELPPRTDHAQTLKQIGTWYTSCVKSHHDCRLSSPITLPTRLLDIQAPACPSKVRLIETRSDLPSSQIDYACLSHCWGKSRPRCITLKETLEKNKEHVEWDAIPLTFQDVIEALRSLGFRYLWIDSLCIIQNDIGDWEREAASMCDVYTGAALTLAATNSLDSQAGLYSDRSTELKSSNFTLCLQDGASLSVFARKPIPHFPGGITQVHDRIEDAPLLKRGWVLQEMLLSRRIVHFGENEVTWECLRCSECQCRGGVDDSLFNGCIINPTTTLGYFLRQLKNGHTSSRDTLTKWYDIVEEYTKLQLTFSEDKFPALSGLAKRILQYRAGDEYIAGLWREDLIHSLSWCSSQPLYTRPASWIAPTWSWAAMASHAWWPYKCDNEVKPLLTSIQPECHPATIDPTGKLKSAKIVAYGLAAEATLVYIDMHAPLSEKFGIQVGKKRVEGSLWVDYLLESADEYHLPPNSKLLCLGLFEVLFLGTRREFVFLVLGSSKRNPGQYERVGLLRIDNEAEYTRLISTAAERRVSVV